jgi:hypothetical protein
MRRIDSRTAIAVASCSALLAVLNAAIAPLFWNLTRLPFACDIFTFSILILVGYWSGRPGAPTATGVTSSLLTLALRPEALHMLGFLIASIAFDLIFAWRRRGAFSSDAGALAFSIVASTICALIAGLVIGSMVMRIGNVAGIAVFAALHGVGGALGGLIGFAMVGALKRRGVRPIESKA